MRVPTPAQLLQVWERGCESTAAERALLLLAAVDEDGDVEALARLPIGRRDALLIGAHAQLFREHVVGLARCPHCRTELEAGFDCKALLDAQSGESRDEAQDEATHRLRIDGRWLHFRLPDSHDLMALHALTVEHDGDAEQARALLLTRCLLPGADDRPGALTPRESEAVSAAMATADPLADLRLNFRCPACETAWDATFDPLRFVWDELQAWALRTLREIDLIARVYHWREADILALGPQRRRAYLELCAT